jgi:CBS-domain-containing membrane protein
MRRAETRRPHRRSNPPQRLVAGFAGTTLGLLCCVGLLRLTDHPWLLPSLGGSCVIFFGVPRGMMVQPRSFLGGHVLATMTELLFRWGHAGFGGPMEVWAAASVGTALALMMATRTIDSSAGANPIVVSADQVGPGFLLAPLLPGLLVLFVVATAVNNLPRPWGAGPWPRFHEAARRRPVVASAGHPRGSPE